MDLVTDSKLRVHPFCCSEFVVCIHNAVVKQLAGESDEEVAASEDEEQKREEEAGFHVNPHCDLLG